MNIAIERRNRRRNETRIQRENADSANEMRIGEEEEKRGEGQRRVGFIIYRKIDFF